MDAAEAAEILAFVNETLTEEGRLITLVQFDQTPSDPSKPHIVGTTDPFVSPKASVTVPCAFVPLSSLQVLGLEATKSELVSTQEVYGIFAPSGEIDFAKYEGIIDGNNRYSVTKMSRLKPGAFTFVWAFIAGVRNAG